MSEFFEAYEDHGSESFSELEKAMEDTVVISAARQSKRMAELINSSSQPVDVDIQNQALNELDQMVSHVLDTTVRVSGRIQKLYEEDEARSYDIGETMGEFKGFITRERDGKLAFDYLFAVPVDAEDNTFVPSVVMESKIEEGDVNFNIIMAHAPIDDVYLKFSTLHPIRARAWLEATFPETLSGIDERIIHDGNNADERAILGLRGFSINLNKEDMEFYGGAMYINSIDKYIRGMISLDNIVPYIVDIDGEYIKADAKGEEERLSAQARGVLFTARSLHLFSKNENEEGESSEYSFGLAGVIHSDDPDILPNYALIPIESIKLIRSMRRIVTEVFPVEASTH